MCANVHGMGHSQIQTNSAQSSKGAVEPSVNTCTPNNFPVGKNNWCRREAVGRTVEKMPPKIYTSPIAGQEVGERSVDFFKELVHHRNCQNVASRILSFLTPKDLRSVCCVSRAWRTACLLDSMSNTKRLKELDSLKKNLFKLEEENELQPKDECVIQPTYARGPFGNIENFVEIKRRKDYTCVHEPSIPSRYQLFREEAKKLLPCESLQPCPRCTSPSRVDPYLKRGLCSREGCAYNFCTKCCCQYHDCQPCPILSKPRLPHKDLIGSKASRRNLKRL